MNKSLYIGEYSGIYDHYCLNCNVYFSSLNISDDKCEICKINNNETDK